ncbi:MAG: hypothetical protein RI964_2287 [Pseudomonadota bacterium]
MPQSALSCTHSGSQGFGMKYRLLCGLLALGVSLAGCDNAPQHPDDLPWQVTLSSQGNPQVFHLEVGKSTLKDAIEHIHDFPETAVFAHESGKRTLEAYFGKQKIGLFDAKIVLDLQIDDALLTKFQQNTTKHEGMASGMWKHTLAEGDVQVANGLPIRKLVYIPSVDYSADIITARFGEPAERLSSSASGVELWCYPAKGLLIALDSDGADIFYYTTQANYPVLKKELLEAKPQHD